MSFTGILSSSGNLLAATGVIHSTVGLLVPELQEPLFRTIQERTVDRVADVNDRYQRNCAVWFQITGVMMFAQGLLLRDYCRRPDGRQNNSSKRLPPPAWFGWYLTILSVCGLTVMPESGFWLVLAQGIWILLQ